mmetsp:Transcript_28897/g.27797  ORF Transcript_28897/g.27797 Transcript_28897/m.27797 type:complete len:299 (-) Transcript_28897:73-969(-)
MAHPDNRVEYDLWFSSILDLTKEMIVDLGTYSRAFGSHTLFTPRIYTYNCMYCPAEVKNKNCIFNGEYCSFLPRFEIPANMKGVTGKEFLVEAVRSRCAYEVLKAEGGEGQNFFKWYNYIMNFDLMCKDFDHFTARCAEMQLSNLGLNVTAINMCMDDSFEHGDDSKDNKYLKEDRQLSRQLGIMMHPSVTINNITYKGEITGYDVFKAICAGFLTKPDICKGSNIYLFAAADQEFFMKPKHARFERIVGMRGMSLVAVIFAVSVVLVFNLFLFYMYRRQQKDKMKNQLQSQVNQAVD